MKNPRLHVRTWRLVARVREDRLFFAPGLHHELVAELRRALPGPSPVRGPESGLEKCRGRAEADRRALPGRGPRTPRGVLPPGGSTSAAFRLWDAARALSGAEYDHGEESLPARFLRIRFYDLLRASSGLSGGRPASSEIRGRSVCSRRRGPTAGGRVSLTGCAQPLRSPLFVVSPGFARPFFLSSSLISDQRSDPIPPVSGHSGKGC